MGASKRRKIENRNEFLSRDSVLGAFRTAAAFPSKPLIPRTQNYGSLDSFALIGVEAVAGMPCISTQQGARRLEALKAAMGEERLTGKAVAEGLLDEDECSSLCCMSALVDANLVAPGDVNPNAFARAVGANLRQEMRDKCSCEDEDVSLVAPVVRVLVAVGRCSARDDLLVSLIAPLLPTEEIGNLVEEHSYVTAQEFLLSFRASTTEDAELKGLAIDWIRRSLLLPDAERKGGSSTALSGIWPQSLAGVAVGEEEVQYMPFGEAERDAVDALYMCATASDCLGVFRDLLDGISGMNARDGEDSLVLGSHSWPRVARLVRRVCDVREKSDTSPADRDMLASLVISKLCDPSGVSEPIACVLLAYGRLLWRCGRNMRSDDDAERGYRDYEKWFAQVVASVTKASLRVLSSLLCGLVPIEPVRYLKAGVKAMLRSRGQKEIMADVVALWHTRIQELGNEAGLGHRESRTNGPQEDPRKTRDDVVRFVREFAEKGHNIPHALVRLMQFYRFYFRTTIMASLLDPQLSPGERELAEFFPNAGLAEFNRSRIALIKKMAFERKDPAVTAQEAELAIRDIEKSLAGTTSPADEKEHQNARIRAEGLTHENSYEELLLAFSYFSSRGTEACASEQVSQSWDTVSALIDCLARKVDVLLKKPLPEALEETFVLVEAFVHVILTKHDFLGEPVNAEATLFLNSRALAVAGTGEGIGDESGEAVAALETSVAWVRFLLLSVGGIPRFARFRKLLQNAILVAVLAPDHHATGLYSFALAIVVAAVSSLAGSPSMHDLVFLVRKQPTLAVEPMIVTIVDHLPLDTTAGLQASTQFLVSYMLIVFATGSAIVWDPEANVVDGVPEAARRSMRLVNDRLSRAPCDVNAALPRDDRRVSLKQMWIGNPDHQEAAFRFVPPCAVRMLRWLVTSMWRLCSVRPTSFTEALEHCSANSSAPNHGSDADENAPFNTEAYMDSMVGLLRHPLCANVKLDAFSWAKVEARAGSGSLHHAAAVLRRFASSDEVQFTSICLAIEALCRHVDVPSSRPNCSWLERAVQTVAWDAAATDDAPVEQVQMRSREAALASTHERLEPELLRGGYCSTLRFLELSNALPSQMYFVGFSIGDIEAHTARILGVCLWKGLRLACRVLVRGYCNWSSVANGELKPTVPAGLCIASSVYPSVLAELSCTGSLLNAEAAKELVSRAEALARLARESFSSGTIREDWRKSCSSAVGKVADPSDVGSAMALFLMRQIVDRTEDARFLRNDMVRHEDASPGGTCCGTFEELSVCADIFVRLAVFGVFRGVADAQHSGDDASAILAKLLCMLIWASADSVRDILADPRTFGSSKPIKRAREVLGLASLHMAQAFEPEKSGPDVPPTLHISDEEADEISIGRWIGGLGLVPDHELRHVVGGATNMKTRAMLGSAVDVYIEVLSIAQRNADLGSSYISAQSQIFLTSRHLEKCISRLVRFVSRAVAVELCSNIEKSSPAFYRALFVPRDRLEANGSEKEPESRT